MKKSFFLLMLFMLLLPLLMVACSDEDDGEPEATNTTIVEESADEGGEQPTGEGGEQPTGEGGEQPTGEGGEQPTGEGGEQPTGEGGEQLLDQPTPETGAEGGEQLLDQPTAPPAAPASTLDGQWTLNLVVNQWMFTDGHTEDAGNIGAQIIANLTQSENILTGQFQNVTIDGFSDACQEAQINGSVQGEQVEWTMSYTGACCNGFNIRFVGTRNAESSQVTGNFEPVGPPPPDCRPWLAQVTGTKQAGP